MTMRVGIIILVLFAMPILSVHAQIHDQSVIVQDIMLVYFAEPDDILDIRMELYNDSDNAQTFTGLPANVTIRDPYGIRISVIDPDTGKWVKSFNHTVTAQTHVWFGWKVPHDAPLGNYSILAFDYDTLINTSARVVVYIPYVIVITGFVMNSYGSTYPSYPVTFINFNRTEFAEGWTDESGYYSVVLTNTTIGDTLYGIAKMIAEESSVTLIVIGNFTQSFHTQQLNVGGGGAGGGAGGGGRANSIAQRDGVFYGAIAMAFISLGTASVVMVKMAKK